MSKAFQITRERGFPQAQPLTKSLQGCSSAPCSLPSGHLGSPGKGEGAGQQGVRFLTDGRTTTVCSAALVAGHPTASDSVLVAELFT